MTSADPIAAWTLQRDALLNCWPETYDLMRPAFNAGDALAAECERLRDDNKALRFEVIATLVRERDAARAALRSVYAALSAAVVEARQE